jgi:hypothetical protein
MTATPPKRVRRIERVASHERDNDSARWLHLEAGVWYTVVGGRLPRAALRVFSSMTF